MLEKEIERKKEQLTPKEIEDKWKAFRKEMRKRRGLPEEEVFPAPATGEPAGKPIEEEEKELTPEEKQKLKQQKLREVDELFRIEKEMLEKKIERDKPEPEEEEKLRAELQEKIEKQKKKVEELLDKTTDMIIKIAQAQQAAGNRLGPARGDSRA